MTTQELTTNQDLITHARFESRPCDDYSHAHGAGRVVLMSAGSYGGDILDDSNSATLEDMARAWIDDDRAIGDGSDIDFHARMASIYVCVDPDVIDPELLGDIIASAEAYAEYPVLDESDYSAREWEAWNEALEWEVRNVPEEHRTAVAEWVSENRYGHSDPGYVAEDWVTEAMRALGLTHRRVTCTPISHHYPKNPRAYAYEVSVIATDADGYASQFRMGRIGAAHPQFGIR